MVDGEGWRHFSEVCIRGLFWWEVMIGMGADSNPVLVLLAWAGVYSFQLSTFKGEEASQA